MKNNKSQWLSTILASTSGFLIGFIVCLRLITILLWRRKDKIYMRQLAHFNRQYTNRITRSLAGHKNSPYAIIEHIGRHSGRHYTTPVTTTPIAGGFIIPIAYGDESDWCRNLMATGKGTLTWQGKHYAIEEPKVIEASAALPAFPALWRWQLYQYDIPHFVQVKQTARAGAISDGKEPIHLTH